MRLIDYYRGDVTLRELLTYVEFIVADPRSLVQLENDERQAWTVQHYLLADIWSALAGKRHPLVPDWTPEEFLDAQPELVDTLTLARAREDERQARLTQAEPTPTAFGEGDDT